MKVHNTKNAATRRLSSEAGDAPLAATLIYVSQDTSDVQYAAKEIARKLDETEDGSQVFEGGGENDVGDAGVKMTRKYILTYTWIRTGRQGPLGNRRVEVW